MRILVTGADGQLGRELRRIADFIENGGDGKKSTFFRDPPPCFEGVDAKKVHFPEDTPSFLGGSRENFQNYEWLFTDFGALDVTDERAVAGFFNRERPDAVVNCAAFTDVDRAETEPTAAFRVNRDAPMFLARAAASHNATLLHISTDFVFSGTAQQPYTETDTPAPINIYGQSKLAGERAVIESCCRGAIVRTSWLYSPWGRNFVLSILKAAASRSEISVVADQHGCPTSATSLATAIARMLPTLIADTQPADIFHWCDAGVVSRADFAAEIIRQAGLPCQVTPLTSAQYQSVTGIKEAAERPKYSALDTKKTTSRFDLHPNPWQQELKKYITSLQYGC
ncbi:MAG: dTDP-4-dehydrorhamnose reductase [Alistipes sp.]|jgi:dTDP-4-dehydrorhamnose reductase|nr:dTDP-4-dehydrorhamnose reductase [Alistipes sp.]